MSSISSVSSTYRYAGRYNIDNQNNQTTNNAVQKAATATPQRETELKRQLDERLSSQIARIRRQGTINTGNANQQTEGGSIDLLA